MFDKSKLQEALVNYKENFISSQWKNEKYKWEAVKCFQENWDVNATDFADMLARSLAKTFNLLTSAMYFPKKMIEEFAEKSPEVVRAMFIALFDEKNDIVNRIIEFKDKSSYLLAEYWDNRGSHYQTENAISTYLWLRYPDKYYSYKYSEVKTVANELDSDVHIKKGAFVDNLRNFYSLYDEICADISKDTEITSLLKSQLDEKCYADPEYKTLTHDVGVYISKSVLENKDETTGDWGPADYSPEITVAEWLDLLNDKNVFTESSLEIMKRIRHYGGQATCTQLAAKYGKTAGFYNVGSQTVAKKVADATNCPVMENNNYVNKWWPVLYQGKKAEKNEEGVFIWKLRDELSEALDMVDLSSIELYSSIEDDNLNFNCWWLNANPKVWSFNEIAIGETQSYTLYNDNGNKRRIFQNFLDAKAGDMIIGYESNPVKQVVAIGKFTSEQDGEQIYFEKIEALSSPIDYITLKNCLELEKMEYFSNPQGSLFKLTKGEYDFIYDLIREDNPIHTECDNEKYSKEKFLEEVYMTENRYDVLSSVLKNKKNIILQGAPGVGKTFAAKRLAYSIMTEKDDNRIEFVQFHQNYSYEDFMMGYKPNGDGFELKNGIFYRFCQKAINQPEKDYFFIIDEINRGNMSKIFGELLMLIEKDYRGTRATLAYNGLSFFVPKNLYLIGMMNTADRSLAMIDYALRRRFSFFDIEPGFDSEGFIEYRNSLDSETMTNLISKICELNNEITNDKSLGKGFCIGHSYFCNADICTDEWLHSVVEYDILPMLAEYWFDDDSKLKKWENILRGVFQ